MASAFDQPREGIMNGAVSFRRPRPPSTPPQVCAADRAVGAVENVLLSAAPKPSARDARRQPSFLRRS